MNLGDLVRGAFVEIRAHKTRSALTCVSLAVGVAAALYTLSQVASIRASFRESLDLAGPGRLEIRPKSGFLSRGLSHGLTYSDARALRAHFPELYMVSPLATQYGVKMSHEAFRSEKMAVSGVTEEWRRRDWVYRMRGRFLDARDVQEAARVCVLIQPGGWVHKPFWAKYFPVTPYETYLKKRDLLGEDVLLERHLYRVVGVLKEPPRDEDPRWFHDSEGEDGTVLVPITAFREGFVKSGEPDAVRTVIVDTGDAATAGRWSRAIDALLLYRHRDERDFEIKDYREIVGGAMDMLRSFLVSIAAIGLVAILAGGIGILNVTLATVFSRVREIGVRRALGATRLDILSQFVIEGMLLGLLGGILGVVLGLACLLFIADDGIAKLQALEWWHALAALLISVGTSFLFSLYPAYSASALDPAETLRSE